MPITPIQKSTYFPGQVVTEIFDMVAGHSALAKVSAAKPMPFCGSDVMTFTSTDEAAIVGEGAAKPAFSGTNGVVQIRPLKFVFGQRVNEEFIYASEEVRLNYLRAFRDAFAKKIARALDIAAFQGIDPNGKQAVSALSTNNFHGVVTNVVSYDASNVDANVETAIGLVAAADKECNGIIVTPSAAAALAAIKSSGVAQFPELMWGGKPEYLKGLRYDSNSTLAFNNAPEMIAVGDFANAFRWGYAKEIPLEVIQYGDPDGEGDLKRYNQVYLRAEFYIGWGILDKDAFALVQVGASV